MTKEETIEERYDAVIEMTKVYNNNPEKLIEFMLDINEALRDESYRNISLDNKNETLRNEIRNRKLDQFREWESAEKWGRLTGDYEYFDQCNETYCDL